MKHFLFISLLLCAVQGWAFHALSVGHQLLVEGGTVQSGHSEETGVWIVAIGKSDNSTQAALNARKEIAGFLNTTIRSASEMSITEQDEKTHSFFSTKSVSSIDQLLKGVRIESNALQGDSYCAIAVLTEKAIDASQTLADAVDATRPNVVTAIGTGKTKDEAIQVACRSALEQVCGTSLVATDIEKNDLFYSRTYADVQGAVKTYRILEEADTGSSWTVKIVAEVSRDVLHEHYGAQMKSIGDPLFLITSDNDEALVQLSDWFITKGLKTTTMPNLADYKINITTTFTKRVHPTNRREGTQLLMKVVCFDKAAVQLFALQNTPSRASSFVGTSDRQQQIVVEKAVKQMDKPLHTRLQEAMNNLVNNGRSIRLVFYNCQTEADMEMMQKLIDLIPEIPVAQSVSSSYDHEKKALVIRCTIRGTTLDFFKAIQGDIPDLPIPNAIETNKIIFTL